MGTIDLTIPGDPASIYSLAEWLSGTVSTAATEIKDRLNKTAGDSGEFWEGRTGEGFRETARSVASGADPVQVYASDAAEVFRAYARRLERGKEEFDGYIDEALASALIVGENTISHPMPPKTYVTRPGQAAPIEFGPGGECIIPLSGEAYQAALELFDRIGESVGSWWGDLDNWINEHIVPLIARVTELDPIRNAFEILKQGNEAVRGFPLALVAVPWETQLKFLQEEGKKAQTAADDFYKNLRKGNPAVSGPLKKTSRRELQAVADVLAERVGQLKVGTKIVIPGSGLVIDIVAASVDVANGGSISSGVVGIGGSLAGGAGGAALLGSTSIPPVAIALIVAAISYGVGWVGVQAWESLVPLDIREAIDAGDFEYVFK